MFRNLHKKKTQTDETFKLIAAIFMSMETLNYRDLVLRSERCLNATEPPVC